MSKKITTEEFIKRAKEIHSEKYNYSLVNYINNYTNIKIICSVHGIFEQQPNNHLCGKGCKLCGLIVERNYKVKYNYNFNSIQDENDISYYLLGAVLTDGCIHKSEIRPKARSLSLSSIDYDWLNNIKYFVCPELPIKKEKTCNRLYFNQIKFVDWFIKHGITTNKSLIVDMPEIPLMYLRDFVRGCLDGDGHIGIYENKFTNKYGHTYTYDKPGCYICSASELFIHKLNNAILNVGFTPCLTKAKQSSSEIEDRMIFHNSEYIYYLKFSSKNSMEFLKWAYYNGCQIYMSRKLQLVKEIQKFYELNNG